MSSVGSSRRSVNCDDPQDARPLALQSYPWPTALGMARWQAACFLPRRQCGALSLRRGARPCAVPCDASARREELCLARLWPARRHLETLRSSRRNAASIGMAVARLHNLTPYTHRRTTLPAGPAPTRASAYSNAGRQWAGVVHAAGRDRGPHRDSAARRRTWLGNINDELGRQIIGHIETHSHSIVNGFGFSL